MENFDNGFALRGKVTDVTTRQTKKNETVFTYYVSAGRQTIPVKSMKNGLHVGDDFFSTVNVKAWAGTRGGAGLDVWENDRLN